MPSLTVQRRRYVQEWAVKAHRSPSDVYVPESLQPSKCYACGWRQVDGVHRGCSEGRW